MYYFQADEHATPVFYINKQVWCDNFKKIILDCLEYRFCYLLIEPDESVSNRVIEMYLDSKARFIENYERIEKFLGI